MSGIHIVDGNSICHAAHNATRLSVGDMETQAIFGTLKAVQKIALKDPDWDILVLWDGKAQWRFDLCPEYKGTRKATNEKEQASKDSYKRQSPFVRKGLQLMGVRQLVASSAEADDMGGLMVKKLSALGKQIKLTTGDKDWLQLVRPGVVWFDPIRDRSCNISNFFEFTGYKTPEQFLDGKALMGDSSDNICGVGGIGEKGAPEFLSEFGSVARFYELVEAGKFVPKKKAHQNLCGNITKEDWMKTYSGGRGDDVAREKHAEAWPGQGRLIFERNRKLMNLLDVPTPPKEDVTVMLPTPNRDAFKALCERLAFHSILREFDSFLAPFEQRAARAA